MARSSCKEKAAIFYARLLITREIMRVGMCSAILGNDLKDLTVGQCVVSSSQEIIIKTVVIFME